MDTPTPAPQPLPTLCPSCKTVISPTDIFCPHCGKQLQAKVLSTSFLKQTAIYLISFFLPPFGLIYVFPYLKQPSQKAKIVGIIALGLTIVSLGLTLYILISAINTYSEILNSVGTDPSQLNSQLEYYKQLGL